MKLEYRLLDKDITLARREQMVQTFSSHSINCSVNDTVSVLRQILQLIKNVFKQCKDNPQVKELTIKVLQNSVLTRQELDELHADLIRLGEIVQDRLGAYTFHQ